MFLEILLSNIKRGSVGLNNACLYKKVCYPFDGCLMHFAFFLLVHSDEENDVLQHACAYGSEESGRDPAQSDREEENYVTVT